MTTTPTPTSAPGPAAGGFVFPELPHAACIGHRDPNIWHPETYGLRHYNRVQAARAEAVSICNTCPERVACLSWAIDNDMDDGIWGGLDPAERKAL